MSPYERIIGLLDGRGCKYELIEHPPTVTSRQAADALGHDLRRGAKALLLKSGDGFVLCVMRGDNQLDYKKLRAALGTRKLRFATPEEVVEVTGVEIGACYPFGKIAKVKMLVDESLSKNRYIVFSPGLNDVHLKLSWQDYALAAEPELADLKR
jgi:Ala-tRNA(Pro) deacylase